MTFDDALKAMENGEKVRRPDWPDGAYWHMVKGCVLRGDGTPAAVSIASVFSLKCDDWEIAPDARPTFGFDEAIRRLKDGKKLQRKGWNGKNQHILLGENLYYETQTDPEGHKAVHKDSGSKAVVFVGTRGSQVGWLASQSDMLAEDWQEVDE